MCLLWARAEVYLLICNIISHLVSHLSSLMKHDLPPLQTKWCQVIQKHSPKTCSLLNLSETLIQTSAALHAHRKTKILSRSDTMIILCQEESFHHNLLDHVLKMHIPCLQPQSSWRRNGLGLALEIWLNKNPGWFWCHWFTLKNIY